MVTKFRHSPDYILLKRNGDMHSSAWCC